MIRNIRVSGFRSLQNFKMKITPGLNILIGPNGSGKTNIILFFEFLSKLSSMPLAEAINSCGGIGQLFQRIQDGNFVETIKCKIEGDFLYFIDSSYRTAFYEIEFIIRTSKNRDYVFFESQRLSFSTVKPLIRRRPKTPDFQILDNRNSGLVIENMDIRKVRNTYFKDRILSAFKTKKQRISEFEKIIDRQNYSGQLLPFSLHNIIPYIDGVLNELVGGETFNILPNAVRKSEDAATPPGIKRDGAGLAATLYALNKSEPKLLHRYGRSIPIYYRGYRKNLPSRRKFVNKQTFNRILKYTKIVNNQISSIEVDTDHIENLIKIGVTISEGETKVKLPFALLSDGTIKWIALLTAIFTHDSIFAIEEPENFIHPAMQQEILKIMREEYEDDQKNSFVLLTSHSETLLNEAQPSEIILVSMEKGATISNRPKDPKAISEEISRSGFGLGHIYYSGSLNYV